MDVRGSIVHAKVCKHGDHTPLAMRRYVGKRVMLHTY